MEWFILYIATLQDEGSHVVTKRLAKQCHVRSQLSARISLIFTFHVVSWSICVVKHYLLEQRKNMKCVPLESF